MLEYQPKDIQHTNNTFGKTGGEYDPIRTVQTSFDNHRKATES